MRPTRDQYFLKMAELVASRATCRRRRVGCVLVNKHNHVIATGYNGVPRDFPHCTDAPCAGANSPTGEDLDKCLATHAEQNALLQCPDVESIETVYVTVSPCLHCVKLLLNTGAKRIVFSENYAGHDLAPMEMWTKRHTYDTWCWDYDEWAE